jgi:hypothetical protein
VLVPSAGKQEDVDDERLSETFAGLHLLAFAVLLRTRFAALMTEGT